MNKVKRWNAPKGATIQEVDNGEFVLAGDFEGEIAKRDAELAACRVAVENCEVFRARIAELEAKYLELASLSSRISVELPIAYAAPVPEAKAQEPVAVVAWPAGSGRTGGFHSAAHDSIELEPGTKLYTAPSPAGVDGCKCSMSISMLGDGCRHCQPQEYIDRIGEMLDEERSELSAAQAIIDGLRGENETLRKRAKTAEREAGSALKTYKGLEKVARVVSDNSDQVCGELNVMRQDRDQQARRIGELEGLLDRVKVSLSLDDTEWGYSAPEKYKLLGDIKSYVLAAPAAPEADAGVNDHD